MRAGALLVLFALMSCTPEGARIEDLIDVGGLGDVRVLLEVQDDDGAFVAVFVSGDDGPRAVETPFELPCPEGTCALDLQVPRETLSFSLRVLAKDRCDTESTLFTIPAAENPVEIGPFDSEKSLSFLVADLSLDEDDDGIPNAFEQLTCGRFDVADALRGVPSACVREGDPCCAASPLIATTAAVGDVHFGSTEVTVGVVARCVARGACPLAGANAAFIEESETRPFASPTRTLSVLDAEEVCGALGGRLPTDVEWSVAAGEARTFPFGDTATDLSCDEGAAFSANFAAAGQACPDDAVAVGRYESTFVDDGGGTLADLAGNLIEWTVDGDDFVLRGGAFDSPVDLLRNNVSFRIPASDDVQLEAVRATGRAGFRCAFDAQPDALEQEPACN